MLFELPNDDVLYEALLARSDDYEGMAFVCVKSTGIFCRLSCPARKPKRENTIFFESAGTCMEAGFRPCQRCHPLREAGAKDPLVDRLLDLLDRHPDRRWVEGDLVMRGFDPSTVRRAFKRTLGITFLELARHRRLAGAARQIADGSRVIEAQLDAGYESASGFRAAFARLIGRAPVMSQGREVLFADWIETPVGSMIAIADQTHLHLLEFHDRKALPTELRDLQQRTRSVIGMGRTPAIDCIDAELKAYFAGDLQRFETPLAPDGTAFERQVWDELLKIPFGETRSYADVARTIGNASAVRAVARANGTNRIAIVIPCHRVIGSDGSLTGYGGGLERKQWLLRHEGRARPIGLFEERT